MTMAFGSAMRIQTKVLKSLNHVLSSQVFCCGNAGAPPRTANCQDDGDDVAAVAAQAAEGVLVGRCFATSCAVLQLLTACCTEKKRVAASTR